MKNLKIKTKLALLLTLFVVVSTGAIVYSLVNIKSQRADAMTINLAGRQRALSQMMGKSVLGLYKSALEGSNGESIRKAQMYKTDILQKKDLFDKTLNAFIDGGELKNPDGTVSEVPRTVDAGIRAKLDESKTFWAEFSGSLETVLARITEPQSPELVSAVAYVEGNNVALFKDMNKLTSMYQEWSNAKLAWFKTVLYAGVVLNLLTFGVVLLLVNRLIINRLAGLHGHMTDITRGEGDLTKRVNVTTDDEIGLLGAEFNALLGNFEVIISKLMGSTALLKNSSERLNETYSSIAEGIGTQDQKTSQVATAMEEMSATVIEVARNASQMTEMASATDRSARAGEVSVNKVVERINDISESAQKSVAVVSSLGDESQKIGNIVQVINDIADQTNLLALNAAIEAARAGEQGRGFAVVADEVRKLAERTTTATKEISTMIGGIQSESRKAVESIEQESANIEEGVALTRQAGEALGEITGGIDNLTDMIRQIATSTEQQSAVASTISADMEAVASVSRDSSTMVRSMGSVATELYTLAQELEVSLSKFKVKNDQSGPVSAGEDKEEYIEEYSRPTLAVSNG